MRSRQTLFLLLIGAAAINYTALPAFAQYGEEEVLAPGTRYWKDADGNIRSEAMAGAEETQDKAPKAPLEVTLPRKDAPALPEAPVAPTAPDMPKNDAAANDTKPVHWSEMENSAEVQDEMNKDVRRSPRENFLMRKKMQELRRQERR